MPDDGTWTSPATTTTWPTSSGFVPAEQPELSIIVVIDEPTADIFGGTVAAPAFADLAQYGLRLYDIPPATVSEADVPEVSASAARPRRPASSSRPSGGERLTPHAPRRAPRRRGYVTCPGSRASSRDERHVDPPRRVEILSVTHDSRPLTAGALFCCVPGRQRRRPRPRGAAVGAGAVALLVERRLDLPVPQLLVSSVREAMGLVADAFRGDPSRALPVVGVTGTSGKTTTSHLVHSIFEAHGWPSGVLGTLTGTRTTPEAPELQAHLAAEARGVAAIAMEVSSHALAQGRVAATRFAVAVFTNLSHDHLDFHGTSRTTSRRRPRSSRRYSDAAVVNLDDPHGPSWRDAAFPPSATGSATRRPRGGPSCRFTWRSACAAAPLVGRFNVSNALAAATHRASSASPGDDRAGLAEAPPVPGRFEPVDEGQPFAVLVDYAHKPGALEGAPRPPGTPPPAVG